MTSVGQEGFVGPCGSEIKVMQDDDHRTTIRLGVVQAISKILSDGAGPVLKSVRPREGAYVAPLSPLTEREHEPDGLVTSPPKAVNPLRHRQHAHSIQTGGDDLFTVFITSVGKAPQSDHLGHGKGKLNNDCCCNKARAVASSLLSHCIICR